VGRNGTEVFGKVFLAILIWPRFSSYTQYSFQTYVLLPRGRGRGCSCCDGGRTSMPKLHLILRYGWMWRNLRLARSQNALVHVWLVPSEFLTPPSTASSLLSAINKIRTRIRHDVETRGNIQEPAKDGQPGREGWPISKGNGRRSR